MAKKNDMILAVIKHPGQPPFVDFIENKLESFQALVGGYIESYTVATDLTILCNEEGLLRGLPYNATILGNPFVGTVVAVGVKGDEFASVKGAHVPAVLRMMEGEEN